MKRFLMGNEAFARAALEAGVGVFAGYPGTPSSELIETVAKLHAAGVAEGIHVEWSTNEKAALEVAAGAAMSGVRALFTCKQVGLNVASDALLSLNYVGVRAGLVLFVADDPGPISSQTEQDTRRFAAFAKLPVLDPATPEQGFEMIKSAFELSERYHTPVIVRPTTRIDHASTYIEVADRTAARIPERGFERDPSRWVIFPKRSYQAHGEINERLRHIAAECAGDGPLARFNPTYAPSGPSGTVLTSHPGEPGADLVANAAETAAITSASAANAAETAATASTIAVAATPATASIPAPLDLAIVTGGDSTMYTLEALAMLQRAAADANVELPSWRLMQIGVPYPFPEDTVRPLLESAKNVLVVEELDSVIEDGLLMTKGRCNLSRSDGEPRIFGRQTDTTPGRGEYSTEIVLQALGKLFAQIDAAPELIELIAQMTDSARLATFPENLPPRPPVLCAGCPHRGSFYAVKQALEAMGIKREDAVFCGDIGCYTLGNAAPLDAVDTCLCMGAGMTMAQGIAVANDLIGDCAGPARESCNPDAASDALSPEPKKAIAFIGDSTFFASGMTGVANAVYNGIDVTFCILDNSTTAMTGMQPHPGTGLTLMGERNEPLSIDQVLRALGVTEIAHADPLDKQGATAIALRTLAFPGPSAIIFESPCVWVHPFATPVAIDAQTCTGCRKCITEIGCPAIGFDPEARGPKSRERGQATIDTTQCNGCGLCIQVCPFNAIARKGPGAEEQPGTEGQPSAEEAQAAEEAPTTEGQPSAEEAQAAEEAPTTEEQPSAEEAQAAEVALGEAAFSCGTSAPEAPPAQSPIEEAPSC